MVTYLDANSKMILTFSFNGLKCLLQVITFSSHIYLLDAKEVCVKMVTGDKDYHDGRVQAVMNGVLAVDGSFSRGEVALDSCFKGLKTIKLHNPQNNGWAGTIEIIDDGKPTTIHCEDCTGAEAETLIGGDICVDGNADSDLLSDTRCQNGATCNLTWEIKGI